MKIFVIKIEAELILHLLFYNNDITQFLLIRTAQHGATTSLTLLLLCHFHVALYVLKEFSLIKEIFFILC